MNIQSAPNQGSRMNPTTIPTEATAEQLRVRAAKFLDATQHYDARIPISRNGRPAGQLIPPNIGVPTAAEVERAQDAYNTVRDNPTYMNLPDDARHLVDILGDLLDTLNGHPRSQA